MIRRTINSAKVIGLLFGSMAMIGLPATAQEPADPGAPSADTAEPADEEPAPEEVVEEVVPPLLEERARLMEGVSELLQKLDSLTLQLESKTGEERLVLLGQIGSLQLDILELFDSLAANAVESRSAGLDSSDLEAFFAEDFVAATPYLIELISHTQTEVLALAEGREELPLEQLVEFEARLARLNADIDHYYEILLEHAARLDKVGLDGSAARGHVLAELPLRVDRVAGRVQLASDQIRILEQRVRDSPDDTAAVIALRAERSKLEWTTASLAKEARILDSIGLPTSQYRQLLISATGNLTEDIFDVHVAQGLLEEAVADARSWLNDNGATAAFRLMLFVLIVAVASMLGRLTGRIVGRALKASQLRTSGLLQEMFANLARRLVLVLGVLFGISQLGIEIGPLLAGLGIIGFAVGFALQETLSNFAAGAMLLVYRPFDAGDIIETGGVLGSVDHLSLVNTTLLTFDNRKIVVPNNKIWGDVITNITAMEIRRVDLDIRVAHSEKVERVETILMEVVKAHPKVLDEPAPLVKVNDLDEASVNFTVRPWAKRGDYLDVRWDLTRGIKLRFEEEGVELALPRRHVVLESRSTPG